MSEQTKLTLSADELRAAQDPQIILTKRAIIEKAAELLAELAPAANRAFEDVITFHSIAPAPLPKISRGENYHGFPYVMLDSPALFEKESIFAVRTMFWWAHFISITIHLSGKYKTLFENNIQQNITEEYYISIGEDEWDHRFGEDNFRLFARDRHLQDSIFQKPFLKTALKFDINDWNDLPLILPKAYKQLSSLLQ